MSMTRDLNRTIDEMNLIIIGMPTAGKTTIGYLLAEALGRPMIDIDEEIVDRIGMPISEFFARSGEAAFRDLESESCRRCSERSGVVIATGGGAIKREENMKWLSQTGIIFWLDRAIDNLVADSSRPLSSNREALCKLYDERRALYEKYSDYRIDNNATIDETVNAILEIVNDFK